MEQFKKLFSTAQIEDLVFARENIDQIKKVLDEVLLNKFLENWKKDVEMQTSVKENLQEEKEGDEEQKYEDMINKHLIRLGKNDVGCRVRKMKPWVHPSEQRYFYMGEIFTVQGVLTSSPHQTVVAGPFVVLENKNGAQSSIVNPVFLDDWINIDKITDSSFRQFLENI